MYKFLAKMNQNMPIPSHGEENVILIPQRDVPARKKFFFQLEEFLQDPTLSCHTLPYPAKCGLEEKTPWLIPYYVISVSTQKKK